MTIEKLPDALKVAQQAESCRKSLKLPKSSKQLVDRDSKITDI